MLLTIFLAIVFCAAITILLISAVAFVQYDGTNKWFFSSAPKEALELLKPRNKELFYGAKTMGWVLMIISILMILGVGVISIWDGFRNGFSFIQFFLRFVLIGPGQFIMCVPSARKRRECFGAGTGREDRKNHTKQLNSRYHAAKLFSCVRQFRRIHVLLSTEVQKKERDRYGTVCVWSLCGYRDVRGGINGAVCALVRETASGG